MDDRILWLGTKSKDSVCFFRVRNIWCVLRRQNFLLSNLVTCSDYKSQEHEFFRVVRANFANHILIYKTITKQSSELFRLRAAWDETVEQLDNVRRENKNLAEEIKDLLDQLGEGGRSIHELDKQRRRLQAEKDELQSALEEAEAALEQEENKVLRAQMEVAQVRQEVERRLAEKEEEFDNTKKNFARAMDSMQASLDGEVKAKQEALR